MFRSAKAQTIVLVVTLMVAFSASCRVGGAPAARGVAVPTLPTVTR